MNDVFFKIVPYETCIQEVISFRNANRILARDRNYCRWRYESRPCQHKAMVVWGTNREGCKVAAASIIPHDFYVLDDVYPVGLVGDISVTPEWRGRGVATQLLQFLRQEPWLQTLRACMVLPNDDAARPLERAGWSSATNIARFVRIVDISPRLQSRFGRRWPVVAAARAINFLVKYGSMDGWQRRRTLSLSAEVGDFEYGFDDLWDEIPKRGKILALRDRRYLHWRYHEHPTVRYRIFQVRHGQLLRGYIVFHVAEDVAVIDDFLTADAMVGPWLFKEFLDHVRYGKLAANIYLLYNADSFLAVPWARFGFVRRRDFQQVMVNVPEADRHSSLPSDENHWFITAGDKDV